jgi:hypothetical protein
MTNLECAIAVLTRHREARRWADEAVAADLLARLGLDPAGDAAHAAPVVDPSLLTEDEVAAAETAAEEATGKAKAARATLNAQAAAEEADDQRRIDAADRAMAARETAAQQEATQAQADVAQQHADPDPAFARPSEHVDLEHSPEPLLPAEPIPPHA